MLPALYVGSMIKYLRLAEPFDSRRMQWELARLEEHSWLQHYNKSHYDGKWSILPLRSIGGNPANIVSIHSSSGDQLHSYQDTPLLFACPYFQTVLNFFKCEKTSVRLMKLHKGGLIKEHRDHEMSFEDGEARFHIPVLTDPGVKFNLDDERIIMEEGECWYLNLSLRHSVVNESGIDRVHLVIDCKVNDWMRKLFTNETMIMKQVEAETKKTPSKEDAFKIIAQLKELNTPTSLQIADQMEKEFNA